MEKRIKIRRIVAALLCLMMLSSNVLAEPAATAGEAFCEAHVWGESGICTVCGEENPVIEEELESEPTSEPSEEEGEALIVPDLMADTTCTHENTERANETTSYSSNAETSHTVIVTYDMVCSSCGETVQAGLTEQSEAVHELKTDGSCNFCDYVADINPMQISISNAIEGHDMIISWSDIGDASYYRYTIKNTTTGEYHNQNQQTDETEAVLQGEKVVAGEKYKIWVGAYNISGKVLCQADTTITAVEYSGSTGGDTCAHVNTVNEVRETVYEYYSEEEHHVITYEDVFCTDCNTIIGEDMKQYGEAHEPDASGICVDCGYAVQEAQTLTLSVGSAVDGKDMTVTWNAIEGVDHYRFNVRDLTTDAAIWGETGRETTNCALTVDAVFMYADHEYKIWVGAYNANDIRICETTTYVTAEAAPKNNLNLWYDTPYAGVGLNIGWADMSDVDHYEYSLRDVTGNTLHYSREETTRNGLTISGDILQKDHTYRFWVGAIGEDGNEPTGEYQATVTFTVNECQHGSPAKINEEYYRVSISDTHHHVEATYDLQCVYCDEIVEEGVTEEYDEEHNFDDNGDCTQCKYTVSCPHTTTKEVETTSNYLTYDEKQHKYVVTYDVVCANAACGKVIKQLNKTLEYYDHEFDGDTCTVCGYTRNAALSVTVTRDAASVVLGVQIAATASANGGSGSYSYSWKVACDGETVHEEAYDHSASYIPTKAGSWVFTVTVTDEKTGETVSASSAAIVVTENACAHEQTEKTRIGTKYVKASDTQHEIQKTYQISCKACGVVINSGYIESDYEAHAYTDGKCVCGISEPGSCAHDGDVITEKVSETVEQHNADKHKVITVYRDVCDSCYAVLEAAREHSTLVVHAYEDGVCACGKLEPSDGCDHATTETRGTPVIERNWDDDANTHYVVTDVSITCDCGKISEQKTEKILVEHDFDYVGTEADHPHKQFKRCDCGVAVYTGKNGYSSSCWTCNPQKEENKEEQHYPEQDEEVGIEAEVQGHVHVYIDGICTECGTQESVADSLINPEECMHMWSATYTENKRTYQQCILCGNKQLIDMDKVIQDQLNDFVQQATSSDTAINNMYQEKIFGNSGKSMFNHVSSAILDQYAENGNMIATTEEAYQMLTSILGYVGETITGKNYEKKLSEELELLIKSMLARRVSGSTTDAVEEEKHIYDIFDKTNNILTEFVYQAQVYDKLGLGSAARDTINTIGDYSGNALDAIGWVLDGVDIASCTLADLTLLSSLVANYEQNVTTLDALIEQCGDSLIGEACRNVKRDIQHQFIATIDGCKEAGAELVGVFIQKGIENGIKTLSEIDAWMLQYNVPVISEGKITRTVSKTIGGTNPEFIKDFSGIAGGVLLGGDIGALMTYNTGRFLNAKDQILLLTTIDAQVKSSMSVAYNQESEALLPLTQLWLVTQQTGLDATEKYFSSYADSWYNQFVNGGAVESAKQSLTYVEQDEEQLKEVASSIWLNLEEIATIYTAPESFAGDKLVVESENSVFLYASTDNNSENCIGLIPKGTQMVLEGKEIIDKDEKKWYCVSYAGIICYVEAEHLHEVSVDIEDNGSELNFAGDRIQ